MMNYKEQLELIYGVRFFRSLPQSKQDELVHALKTLMDCKVKYEQGGTTYEMKNDVYVVEDNMPKKLKSDPNKIPEIDIVIKRSLDYDNKKVKSSQDAIKMFREFWVDQGYQTQEYFYVLLLNRNNGVIAIYQQSKGGIAATIADVQMICATAVKSLASGVIVCHNHPSGTMLFSEADKKMTKNLGAALKTLNILLMDSMLVVEGGPMAYASMADNGELPTF